MDITFGFFVAHRSIISPELILSLHHHNGAKVHGNPLENEKAIPHRQSSGNYAGDPCDYSSL
jgi:hypothetical protein